MSTLMHGCHPDRPCRHGPTPAVVYLATLECSTSVDALARSSERFIRDRGWPHVATVVEDDLGDVLESRKGWQRILSRVPTEAEIIVVPSSEHLDLDEEGFEALKSELYQSDILLMKVK